MTGHVAAFAFFLAFLAFFGGSPVHAQAPAFPEKPVTIIVPYSPGGGSDNVARAMARHLTDLWKRPVVVENLPGADGLIGTRRVVKAPADGYTLLVSIPAIAMLKYTNKALEFDPLAELVPVTMAASGPTAIVVNGNTEIQAVADLRRVCSEPAAKCSWASGEPFTLLAGTGLMTSLGLSDRITNVRYSGTSAAVADVIGGHVTALVTGISSVVPHHKAGSLRILAVSTPQRIPAIAEVPTYAETGMGAVEFTNNWYGIFAPAGTPESVKSAISEGFRSAAADPAVLKVLGPLLITPVGNSSAEFGATLQRDRQTVERLSGSLPTQ